VLLVVELTVRAAELATFRAFEHAAAHVMARHGGAIERAFVVELGTSLDRDLVRELHIVRFPDEDAFLAYQRDPALAELAELRARAVIETTIRRATDGPSYG